MRVIFSTSNLHTRNTNRSENKRLIFPDDKINFNTHRVSIITLMEECKFIPTEYNSALAIYIKSLPPMFDDRYYSGHLLILKTNIIMTFIIHSTRSLKNKDIFFFFHGSH